MVQPKVASFFPDERSREEFLLVLAHGNRRTVLALVTALMGSGAAVVVTAGGRSAAIGYTLALVLYTAAAGIFANVSWRHWPARVFTLRPNWPGTGAGLRLQAVAMLALVTTGFLIAVAVSVALPGR